MNAVHRTRAVIVALLVMAFGTLAWVTLRPTGHLPSWRLLAAPSSAVPFPSEAPSLHAVVDLPASDPRVHGLSGLSWQPGQPCGWALPDRRPVMVRLCADPLVSHFTLEGEKPLRIPGGYDGEALVAVPDGFLVGDESVPRVLHIDSNGTADAEVRLPAAFSAARRNRSLEAAGFAPDGPCAFAMSEVALREDGTGATIKHGTAVRLVRHWLASGTTESLAYVTESAPWDGAEQGVTDMVALDVDHALVLERAWEKAHGNVVRIFVADLSRLQPPPQGSFLRRIHKTLWVDFSTLPAEGLPPPPQPQPHPLLSNSEAMAFGPTLPDGRATLLVLSDDNGRADQVARMVVLAFRPRPAGAQPE